MLNRTTWLWISADPHMRLHDEGVASRRAVVDPTLVRLQGRRLLPAVIVGPRPEELVAAERNRTSRLGCVTHTVPALIAWPCVRAFDRFASTRHLQPVGDVVADPNCRQSRL